MKVYMGELLKRTITGTILTILLFLTLTICPNYIFSMFMALILSLILLFEWPKLVNCNNKFFWLTTLIYPILPFVLIIVMQQTGYRFLNMLLIAVAFANDTGSYIFGKLLGKHKILPEVSPQKSWEGFIGGYIFTAITVKCFYIFTNTINFYNLFILIIPISFIFSFIALAGDLFESYLKRKNSIKDSSNILPGHGGLLDRFDSIMFLAVLFFILKDYLINLF